MSVAEPSSVNVRSGDILAEKYRVDRVLGQGAMGVVVLAEHIELRERVAIKFLLDEAAGNLELAERFIREARAAVRIKSEHVVRVIDVGRLPSGAPYMVMEYLDGVDLAERLLSGPLPIEDAVDCIIQCCEAMHVAHRAGIVHRDLKPANLFLTQRPDGSQLIKILDFGISKVKSPDAAQLSLTHTQAMMGSPLYMSPEQMRSSKDVSASADIWSLGVILHELIAGDVPFSGETFPEVLVKVMSDPPPSLRGLRSDVPEGLSAVVRHCLAKDPAQRYSSVAALAVALTPFASARTSGLQARLASSMTEPPVAPGRAVGATQRIPGASPPIVVPANATERIVAHVPAEALQSRTNTSWGAAHGTVTSAALAGRARRRSAALAGGALFIVAIVALGLLRGERELVPATELPSPASAAAARPMPSLDMAAPTPVVAGPRVAPITTPSNASPSAEAPTVASPSTGADAPAPSAAPTPAEPKVHAAAAPTPPDEPAVTPTSGASARVSSATQQTAKAPRSRVAGAARVAASTPAAPPAPKPAVRARPKPLSIEFK